MTDSHISVVVLNYNAGNLLLKSVGCILDSNIPTELFVCDNNSTDGSLRRLKSVLKWRGENVFNNIHIIENKENIGFSSANNIALTEATGEFILLLNPDCLIKQDALSRMLDVMERRPDVGLAGCRILNEDGTEQAGCRRQLPTPLSGLLRATNSSKLMGKRGIDQNDQLLPDHPVEVEAISGAFMLLRRSAVDDVGLMDEGYFLHCEDLDYCKRFHDKGWKVLFVPNVEVTHYKGTCSRSRPIRVEWHKHRGMARYYDKFLAKDNPLLLNWFVKFGIATRFLSIATIVLAKKPLSLFGKKVSKPDASWPVDIDPCESIAWPDGLMGHSVLVTGATGFVGRRLVDALLESGVDVGILTRSSTDAGQMFDGYKVKLFKGDLTDQTNLADACQGVDTIFHLASYSQPHQYEGVEQDERHFDVTINGSENLINAAKSAGVQKIVFASSVRAADTDQSASAYGRAKRQAEEMLLSESTKSGIKVSILRFPVIYGSVKRGNIFRMMTAIDRGRFPAIPEFHNRRSMIHRDDAVRALIQSACSEKTSGRVFVVTDGESYSSRRIYLSIRAALGKAPSSLYIPVSILRAAARAGDAYARVFKRPFPINTALLDKISGSAEYDGSAFAEEIGFQACYNLESALPTMVSQYRQGSGD